MGELRVNALLGGLVPEVHVSGPRQCGKTEKIIDMVAGGLIAGGTPSIMCVDAGRCEDVRRRLAARLAELGEECPMRRAHAAVVWSRSVVGLRGRTGPTYHEHDR